MGLYTHPPQTSDLSNGTDIAQRRTSSYDVATLHLMAPMDFWRNSTPFFGAAVLCATKIVDFRRRPSWLLSTLVLLHLNLEFWKTWSFWKTYSFWKPCVFKNLEFPKPGVWKTLSFLANKILAGFLWANEKTACFENLWFLKPLIKKHIREEFLHQF